MDYQTLKLAEAMRPSYGAQLAQAGTGPRYTDATGQPVSTVQCGASFNFEVPGYTQVFLEIVKDGVKTFAAPLSVPMVSYQSSCVRDPGNYVVTAYDVTTGQLIGTTSLVITGSQTGALMERIMDYKWLLIGGAALLFMKRRRK